MEDVAVSVASKVAEGLVARVVRACSYVIFYASYLRELKDEVANLDRARQRVQHSVNEAQRNMKQIEADVEKWATDAKSVADKASDMLERNKKAKKTCFYGWFPIPKARYDVVKEARETVKAIQELIPKGQFNKVYCENAPPGLVPDAPNVNSLAGDRGAPDTNSLAGDGGDTITDSRDPIFQGIMKALDDEKHKVIGVYGPGGVGKTTLLEEVEKKLRKVGKPFRMIVKAKVSRTPDLKKIQDDIAYALSLNLKDEPSEEGRKDLLLKRLQQNPSEKVLIILDDLWAELNLKAVGIPLGDASMKCKLLLTSRDKSVLEQKMHADQTFHLEGLNKDEAFRLFEMTVGDKLKDEEFKRIAAKVVKKLAGLPLLINSVASTLKYSGEPVWRNSLKKIDDSNIDIIVKLSYDHLKSEDTKSLFLLCGLIGGTIQIDTLLVLGMGLGLFEEFNDTIQGLRDGLKAALVELRSACLLLDGDDDDKDNVTIHDLYSEVVVSNAFSGQHSLMITNNYGSWPKEKLEKCWACLVNVGNDRLAELMLSRFPHVRILMLSEQYRMGDCSRMDFTYMKKLRALYLCSMHITSLPSSMEILENLRSLSINCYVEDVAIIGKLKALRILSFAMSSRISRLPKEIGELTKLQSLNLSNCYSLKIIEPGVLKRLINLEELHMKGSFDQWMRKREIPSESCGVGLAELKSLTKLTSLKISIPHPIILLEDGDLPFGNLVRFWISIGIGKVSEFEGLKTMELDLGGCDNILSIEWVHKALQKTQCLNLCNLREFKKSAHELCTQGFRELKHLDIDDNPSIKYIANSSHGHPLTAFMKLETLCLKNLIHLEKIYHGPIAPMCFSKLKAVSVEQCDRLNYLWCLSDMQIFVHLEEIKVWKCDSMQSIVTHDAGEEIVSTDNRVELPNVRRLVLGELPNMTSFCSRAENTSKDAPIQVSFPCLESLVMVELLDLERILYGQPPLQYTNLKSLKIIGSKSTSKSILKSDWILKIPNLESLEIERSPLAEVVFDHGSIAPECFSKLKAVSVKQCDRLKYLWCLSHMQRLVQLEEIEVWKCDSMQSIVTHDAGEDIVSADNRVVPMPNVRRLVLGELPNMTSFCARAEITSDDTPVQVSFPRLESLVMVGLLLDLEKMLYIQRPLEYSNLKSIEIKESRSESSFFKSDCILKLPNLESLEIDSSSLAEAVFDSGELKVTRDVEILSRLMELTLRDLPNLRCMWKQDVKLQGISVFRSLKELFVGDTGLAFLFPVSVAKCLREIRDIEVRNCPNMKAVIVDEEGRDEGTDDMIEFPLLKGLHICNCPMEKFFSYPHGNKDPATATSDSQDAYSDSFFDQKQVSLPSLESLWLDSLGSLKRIWHDELPGSSFCELAALTLKNCSELLNIFPSTIIGRLHNLKEVEVSNFFVESLLESLFDCGSFGPNTKILSLPKLKKVEVSGARRLRHMVKSDSHTVLGFPSLTKVKVVNCSELRYLFPNYKATTLGKLKGLWIYNCERMKEVVHKEEGGQSKAEVMSFPSLDSLSILECRNFGVFIQSPTSIERPSGMTMEVDDESPQAFFNEMARFPNIRSLDINGARCKELWNNQIPIDSFCKLKSLELTYCDNLQRIAPSRMWKRLQCYLETLKVDSCHSIEIIFERDAHAEKNGNLRSLILRKLAKLRHIWQYDGLPKGGEIRDIDVQDCPNMKAVIVDEEGRDEGIDEIIEFPLLESVCIMDCPTDKFFSYPHRKKESIITTSDSQHAYSDSFFDPKVSLPSLETLSFDKVGSFKRIWHGELPRSSFCKLATLELLDCSELLNVFPSTIIGRLHNLKSVTVVLCPSLESLFDCGSLDANTKQTSVLLPKLEEVKVWQARKLRSLVKNDSQMIWGFPSLKDVSVADCSDMKYLFPHFTATTLEKLERIYIGQCEQMMEVVPEEEGGLSKASVMSFPSLRHLSISQCPNFGAFIRSPTNVKRQLDELTEENDESPQPLFNEMVTFPNIRELEIEGLWCKELWNNQIPTDSFWKLESLELKNCADLQRIASSHLWKRLQCCLEILEVISCRSIEIIYEGDGTDIESGKLRRLVLRDLENLRHIWQSDGLPNVPFPNLRYVEAMRCSRLKMLFATFMAKFLGQIEELVVESCEDMELIAGHEKREEATSTTITFSKLTALRLFELPKFRSFLPEKHPLKFPYSEDFPSLLDLSIISCGAEPDRGTVDWESHQQQRQERWLSERQARWDR